MCGAAGDFAERGLTHDFDAVGGKQAEKLGQQRTRVGDRAVGGAEIVGAQRVGPRGRREAALAVSVEGVSVGEAGLPGELVLLAFDPRDFPKADLMNLLGGEVGRRVLLERGGIPVGAAGQRDGTDAAARGCR